jgi:hypothetical protein
VSGDAFPRRAAPWEGRLDAITQRVDAVARQLDSVTARPPGGSQSWPTFEASDTWSWAASHHGPRRHAAITGKADTLLVSFPRAAGDRLAHRISAALLLAFVASLGIALFMWGPLREIAVRWPYAWGVLAGIAWWLWLEPSVLGWAIVVLSAVAALRFPFRAVRDRGVAADSRSGRSSRSPR